MTETDRQSSFLLYKNYMSTPPTDTAQVERLQQKYSALLLQHEQAVADYVTYIRASGTDGNNPSTGYLTLPGQMYVGAAALETKDADTPALCESLCATTPGCSGATYDNKKCIMQSGDGIAIASATATDSQQQAIVNRGKYLLQNINAINDQLAAISQDMSQEIQQYSSNYSAVQGEKSQLLTEMVNNYSNLITEKEKIHGAQELYSTLNEAQNNSELKTYRNYYVYLFFLGIAVLAIYTFVKVSAIGSAISSATSAVVSPVTELLGTTTAASAQ